jgi:hypothetical protein
MTTPVRDPERCPLCGGPNACGAARGDATCWCFTAVIPPEIIARVPAEDRGVRCVCAACAVAEPAAPNGRN